MNLVYDVNLKPTLCRLIADIFNDLRISSIPRFDAPSISSNVDRVALVISWQCVESRYDEIRQIIENVRYQPASVGLRFTS